MLAVPLPALRTAMADDAGLARLVGRLARNGSELAVWTACDLLIASAPRRIAAVLLRITAALDGIAPTDPRGFRLTQSELGEMANASRHHVNRVRRHFVEEGWIAQRYNFIRLLDVPALAAFAYRDSE